MQTLQMTTNASDKRSICCQLMSLKPLENAVLCHDMLVAQFAFCHLFEMNKAQKFGLQRK